MQQRSKPVTRKPLVVAGCMLGMFMIAMEATIVATAMPSIVADLGGFSLYSWVFAAYLIAQSAMVMLFGKLGDLFGRRPVLIVGIAFGLVGAFLCGLAWSMPVLIAFRILQGLGSASVQPLVNTIVGDLYPPDQRARVQAFLTSVWVLAAVVGPIFGGLIVEHFSWQWVFWINLPIGALTILLFAVFLHEDVEPRPRSIDYPGAALFSVVVVALLVTISQETPSWTSPTTIVGVVAFVVAMPLLVWQERRAAEPVVAFEFWRDPLVGRCNAAMFCGSVITIGIVSFQPVFVQGVLGLSPLVAGLSLIGTLVSWSSANYSMRFLMPRLDTRGTMRLGACSMLCGGIGFGLLTPDMGIAVTMAVGCFVGFGMGSLTFVSLILIQASVPWSKRGTATATFILGRMLGSAVGVACLGAVLNQSIAASGGAITPQQVRALLGRAPAGLQVVVDQPGLRLVLADAIHNVFLGILVVAVIGAAIMFMIPTKPMKILLETHQREPQAKRQ